MEALAHTYVVSLPRPFSKNLVTELKKTQKVYFWDLRSAVLRNFSPFDSSSDCGAPAENFIFRELA